MRSFYRTLVLLPLLALVAPVSSSAQWAQNGRQIGPDQYYGDIPPIVADGQGGAFVFWSQFLSPVVGIHLQHVDARGMNTWASDIVTTPVTLDKAMVTDGSGGVICVYQEYIGGTNHNLRAQRFNLSGNALWVSGGVNLCDAADRQFQPVAVPDGSGGTIVAWLDDRDGSGEADVYVQRLDAAGNALWTPNGVAVSTQVGPQSDLTLFTPSPGEALLAWTLQSDVYAQKLTPGGGSVWTTGGVLVAGEPYSQAYPAIVSDGADGALLAWQDSRTVNGSDIYAQRVLASGLTLWATDGVPVCSHEGTQLSPRIVEDGVGGAFIAWGDARNSVPAVYAQRITGNGFPLWTGNGVAVSTVFSEQGYPRMIPDGTGGVLIGWNDTRHGAPNINLYGQRLDMNGTLLWAPTGVALCTTPGQQYYPGMVLDGRGGVILAWGDWERGAYVNRMELSYGTWGHPEPIVVSVSDVPGDDGGMVDIAWEASDRDVPAFGTITEYAVWRAVGALPPAGAWQEMATTPATLAASYSLAAPTTADSSAGDPALHYFAVVARTSDAQVFFVSAPDSGYSVDNQTPSSAGPVPSLRRLTLLPNSPNPFSDRTLLRVGLPSASEVSIELFDVAGHRVRSMRVAGARAGWNDVALEAVDQRGARLPSGVYLLRVSAASGTSTHKLVITR